MILQTAKLKQSRHWQVSGEHKQKVRSQAQLLARNSKTWEEALNVVTLYYSIFSVRNTSIFLCQIFSGPSLRTFKNTFPLTYAVYHEISLNDKIQKNIFATINGIEKGGESSFLRFPKSSWWVSSFFFGSATFHKILKCYVAFQKNMFF